MVGSLLGVSGLAVAPFWFVVFRPKSTPVVGRPATPRPLYVFPTKWRKIKRKNRVEERSEGWFPTGRYAI
jgi:hypothetical protein